MEQDGVKTYMAEGVLDATAALGITGNSGTWSRSAYATIVAGLRFELRTFGL